MLISPPKLRCCSSSGPTMGPRHMKPARGLSEVEGSVEASRWSLALRILCWGGRVISARNLGVIRAFNATRSFAHAMLGSFAHSRPEVSTPAKGARALGWERVGEEACCAGQSGQGSKHTARDCVTGGRGVVRALRWVGGGSGPGVLHMTRAVCWGGGGERGGTCAVLGGRR